MVRAQEAAGDLVVLAASRELALELRARRVRATDCEGQHEPSPMEELAAVLARLSVRTDVLVPEAELPEPTERVLPPPLPRVVVPRASASSVVHWYAMSISLTF